MTLTEIKNMLINMPLVIKDDIVHKEKILDIDKKECDLIITKGMNPLYAQKLSEEWSKCKMDIFGELHKLNLTEEEKSDHLKGIDLESLHWDWFKKIFVNNEDSYTWFFLFIDNQPTGACIIFHPKNSYLDNDKIFYIEYIAIAPWNNCFQLGNINYKKKYKGIGPKLIKFVSFYAIDDLKLDYGFSLRSLPQSYSFYESIGMKNEASQDDKSLKYYEMPTQDMKNFLERG